jgi:acyl-homoserine-lactone acylase
MGEMRTLEQYLALNKVKNKIEFEAALTMGTMPSLNYIYTDGEGNIAHYYNAMFPKRVKGWDWQKDLPGNRSKLIWQDYLPFADMPKTVNPPSGLVFNANNTPFVSSIGEGQPQPDQFSSTMGIETTITNRAHPLRRLLPVKDKVS